MIQAAIIILGGLGALLVAIGGRWEAWGLTLAFLAQPFWLVATWRTRQWGMFGMALFYTLVWGAGALRAWGLL